MKAMRLPSGDQRGTAICRPCSEPVTVRGSTIAFAGPACAWVYSLATHQLFSPGGGAAVYASFVESGDQSYSYTYKFSGVNSVS